jgi:branched-chain amino acid transport system ATP-binding protein/sulfate-transporting ATPase
VLLDCTELVVRFGGLTALDGLSLSVDAGEVVGLIGPNGSGKTSFFNALTGIYALSSGKVRFAQDDLTGAAPQRVFAAGITRTFQRSRLGLELSIFDNVVLGALRRQPQGLWYNLVQRSALNKDLLTLRERVFELLHVFNPQLAARMLEPAAAISIIDRRRVEICRALISEPRLLLLDEPSAGMTADETNHLMRDILVLRERTPALAVILIEHDMAVIERITQRVLVLNYGRLIAAGPYAEVARHPAVREAYLGV